MNAINRKKKLIDPSVQMAIGWRVVQHWALFACVLLTINVGVLTFLTTSDGPLEDALNATALCQIPFLAALLVMLPLFVYDTVSITNRFAGPIFRMRRTMRELTSNPEAYEPLQFRRNDFWKELAGEFNQLAEAYIELKKQNDALENELNERRQPELQLK